MNMIPQNIEITIKKKKLVQINAVLIILNCVGIILFLIFTPLIKSKIIDIPYAFSQIGLITCLMCTGLLFIYSKQLWRKNPGVLISDSGITENVSDLAIGFVSWNDIVEIKDSNEINNKYISIIVKNPQHFMNNQKSWFKRRMMYYRYKFHQSVILIPQNRLNISYSDLKELIDKKFNEFKSMNK
jgi:hypothetical protein